MRYLPIVALLGLLLAYGVAEGLWTHRWVESHAVQAAVDRLKDVPKTVGPWKCGEDMQLPDRQVARAEMAGYLSRNYVHGKTDQVLQVLLVCGPPGPTSLHPPEVCFQGAGFIQVGAKEQLEIKSDRNAQPAQFWVGRFQKTGAMREQLRSAWAWSATGQWLAPQNPRFDFASEGALYKLYVNREVTGLEEPREDPTSDFLKEFLPELNKTLFPPSSSGEGKV